MTMERRQFLRWGLGTSAAVAATTVVGAAAQASAATQTGLMCAPTARQTSGPFYPGEKAFTNSQDLTRLPGALNRARGQVVYIRGQVRDSQCRPLANANVEIWQACETGRYNHQNDPNTAALDPDFAYWGETFTDANGEYIFKTIIPGSYPADEGWDRPPHIHFRVSKLGYRELVTQSYFKGHPLNDKDLILLNIPEAQRGDVVVDFQPSAKGLEPNSLTGSFNITLLSVR